MFLGPKCFQPKVFGSLGNMTIVIICTWQFCDIFVMVKTWPFEGLLMTKPTFGVKRSCNTQRSRLVSITAGNSGNTYLQSVCPVFLSFNPPKQGLIQ